MFVPEVFLAESEEWSDSENDIYHTFSLGAQILWFGNFKLVQEPKNMNLTWINLPLLKAIDSVCMQAFSCTYS